MAKIVSDSATVSRVDGSLLEIVHKQPWSDGTELGNTLVMEALAASALADAIDTASGTEKHVGLPPDHFVVKLAGSDFEPIILVQNRRDPSAPRGRTYPLGMREDTALAVAKQLRRV